MGNQVIVTSKNSPAATNRFIYYQDHLARMPGSAPGIVEGFNRIVSFFTEPLFQGMLRSLFRESTIKPRDFTVEDESVGHFLERRFGRSMTDNIASAIFHGIYAGDLYKLSARTLLPLLWYLEAKDEEAGRGVMLGATDLFMKSQRLKPRREYEFATTRNGMSMVERRNNFRTAPLDKLLEGASVYTLAKGLGDLATRLETSLRGNPNIHIRTTTHIESVDFLKGSMKLMVNSDGKVEKHDYLVSTLGPKEMQKFLASTSKASGKALEPTVVAACKHVDRSVNVMVVNLYYSNPDLIPSSKTGFGYLIPRSVPVEENPERALGVIFASETSGIRGESSVRVRPVPRKVFNLQHEELLSLLEISDSDAGTSASSTGGGALKTTRSTPARKHVRRELEESLADLERNRKAWFKTDDEEEIGELVEYRGQDTAPGTKLTVMMGGHWWEGWTESDLPSEVEAIEMAKRLLQRHLDINEQPVVAKARLNRNCIPQYPVGYRKAAGKIHEALVSQYQGRFKVAGPWWQGAVGVNDCIRKGREAAWAIREQWDDKTGLEEYAADEAWYLVDNRTGDMQLVSGSSGG
jgi:oxygen-dependent protoporphyrinogen oxidase